MNSILSRIALAAPVAVAIVGFGISGAEAAPLEVADQSQVQPKPDWNDVVVDDLADDQPDDGPDDGPADPPADEPADEPAEDDVEADEESDEDSDDEDANEGTGSSSRPSPAIEPVNTSRGSADEASDGEAVEVLQTAATELTQPRQAGVQVPVLALTAGGAIVAGVAGWAVYRRHRIFTS